MSAHRSRSAGPLLPVASLVAVVALAPAPPASAGVGDEWAGTVSYSRSFDDAFSHQDCDGAAGTRRLQWAEQWTVNLTGVREPAVGRMSASGQAALSGSLEYTDTVTCPQGTSVVAGSYRGSGSATPFLSSGGSSLELQPTLGDEGRGLIPGTVRYSGSYGAPRELTGLRWTPKTTLTLTPRDGRIQAGAVATVSAHGTVSPFGGTYNEPGSPLHRHHDQPVQVTLATAAPTPTPTCTVTGTAAADVLTGTDGPDTICGLGGDDVITGLGGDDVMTGGPGNDRLDGGAGDDRLSDEGGRNRLLGGPGNDTLVGGPGRDVLRGGDGNDDLTGSGESDRLAGEAGDDRMSGGPGLDVAVFEVSPRGVTVDLAAGTATGHGRDRLDGVEDVYGSVYGDRIAGNAHYNRLFGGNGADVLDGRAGPDQLSGGAHDDRLFGGDGRDLLVGGAGTDALSGGAASDICYSGGGARTGCELPAKEDEDAGDVPPSDSGDNGAVPIGHSRVSSTMRSAAATPPQRYWALGNDDWLVVASVEQARTLYKGVDIPGPRGWEGWLCHGLRYAPQVRTVCSATGTMTAAAKHQVRAHIEYAAYAGKCMIFILDYGRHGVLQRRGWKARAAFDYDARGELTVASPGELYEVRLSDASEFPNRPGYTVVRGSEGYIKVAC